MQQRAIEMLDAAWDAQAESQIDRLVEAPNAYWQTRSDLVWN